MPRTAPISDANPSVAEMEARVARFRNLKPTDDYIDSGIPGFERTTLRVLGQVPHAALAAEGFHMSIIHCEPGKSAPLHNQLRQEVLVVLTGVSGKSSAALRATETSSWNSGTRSAFHRVYPGASGTWAPGPPT